MRPTVPYDQDLLDDVAARLDLRAPNKAALEAIARQFQDHPGAGFEAVCDLATGVGKTYIAAGAIEYLAQQGIRHFIVVTPGRTIQTKTIENFTPGRPKSVTGGMDWVPVLITAEDFATGGVRAALDDPSVVKLFVFNIQQLLRPTAEMSRRTRKFQEWLGADLYAHLQGCPDLVVIADEHHVYQEKATAFSKALRDLDALAVIGLTATPDPKSEDKVIFRYPLAHAIADRLVKTPVLVGRRDNRKDVETQLRDGLVLLAAKARAADAYAEATGADTINPVMFVVADTKDNANAIAEVLRRPGFYPDDYDERVLVIHSDAPDDALARLEAVERPECPVRVIVSVAMLKEGWDVKNIYVICSFRPSISEALTEQTLGRGLRLPWNRYTGIELLDTVEVLSHERYEVLLRRAGVLIEGLVAVRASEPPTTATVAEPEPATTPAGAAPGVGNGPGQSVTQTVEQPAPTFIISSHEERAAQANAEAERLAQPIQPARAEPIVIPRVERLAMARAFSLSDIPEDDFRRIGQMLAAQPDSVLERKVLDIEADPDAPNGFRIVPKDSQDRIQASQTQLPVGKFEADVKSAIMNMLEVQETRANLNAATRLVAALTEAAGGDGDEGRLSAYVSAAADAARTVVKSRYVRAPLTFTERVVASPFQPPRLNTRAEDPNRFGSFNRQSSYTGWNRAYYPVEWFDSSTERDLANLLDASDDIAIWSRIQRGELVILWSGGRYSPDFYAETIDGRHWLVEVKADYQAGTDVVQDKKAAADQWARTVTDQGDYGSWRYLLATESAIKAAHGSWAVLVAAAGG